MKTYFLNIFLFVVVCLSAQNNDALKFENTSLDYGTLKFGEVAECEFDFINTTSTAVKIENLKSNSRNITFKITDSLIQPDQKGTITVIYKTEKHGPIRRTVTVFTNVGVYTLTIKGNVLPKE